LAITNQDPLQLHGQTMNILHQDAKHGAVERGRCLQWRSILAVLQLRWCHGKASASSSLWRPPWGFRLSELLALRQLSSTACRLPSSGRPQRYLLASLANGGVIRHLGFHKLDAEERGAQTNAKRRWDDRPAWAHFGQVRPGLPPRRSSCHSCFLPLRRWLFSVIIPRTKLGGLVVWSPIFSSWSSGMFHHSTLVLTTFGGSFDLNLSTNGTPWLTFWTWCESIL
jgi:hypothetical protein